MQLCVGMFFFFNEFSRVRGTVDGHKVQYVHVNCVQFNLYLSCILISETDALWKVASAEALCVCSHAAITFARLQQGEQTVMWVTGVLDCFPHFVHATLVVKALQCLKGHCIMIMTNCQTSTA